MDTMASLRPVRPEDEGFLYDVYASTRTEELSVTGWTDLQKEQFLQMQFGAQHQYYKQQFPQAEFQIILLQNRPIGRLYVDRRQDEIRIIDIALLTEYRNAGIGSMFLQKMMAEAKKKGKLIRIHVETYNPALRLYRRLGFREIENQGVYLLMEWSPVVGQHVPVDQPAGRPELNK